MLTVSLARECQPKWAFCALFLLIALLECKAQIGPPPIIVVQPLGISVQKGGDAVFAVVAVSGTKMNYKWYRNGQYLGGANSPLYTVKKVNPEDQGNYHVEVKNAAGTAISEPATLIVLTEPLEPVLNILPAAMSTNGFSLQLTVPPGSNVVIMASSDMKTWTPIATNSSANGSVSFTDTNAVNRSFQYYRAELR